MDFFFILSGFVIGYAYGDRWGKTLTVKNFFKRRLVRLHPMVVLGAVLGGNYFFHSGQCAVGRKSCSHFFSNGGSFCVPCFLFLLCPVQDMRCVEMARCFRLTVRHGLLFFEYIGEYLLRICLFIKFFYQGIDGNGRDIWGIALTMFACSDAAGYGSIGVGWTLDGVNFVGGLLRMLFPFSMGMLFVALF